MLWFKIKNKIGYFYTYFIFSLQLTRELKISMSLMNNRKFHTFFSDSSRRIRGEERGEGKTENFRDTEKADIIMHLDWQSLTRGWKCAYVWTNCSP